MGFKQYRSDPLTEREKAYLRRKNGTKQPFSIDALRVETINKERDYYCPSQVRPSKRPGRCVLSPEKRAMVELRLKNRDELLRLMRGGS